MSSRVGSAARYLLFWAHRFAFFAIVAFAAFMVTATVLAATGIWPWLGLSVTFGDNPVENAGLYVQCGLTVLSLMLLFFIPSTSRMIALENSHRNFSLGINDITRAYHEAHVADRKGTFQLSSEFEAVRERLTYLRDHPDLGRMEPEILEAAAQMSFLSRELSETYSTQNVERARDFLRQRQEEIERFNSRLKEAFVVHQELKHWLHEVEMEESVASAQLERLRDELLVILPEIEADPIHPVGKVVGLPRAAE